MARSTPLFALVFLLWHGLLMAKEPQEIAYKPLNPSYIELTKLLNTDLVNDDEQSIKVSLQALNTQKSSFARYNLIYWELAFHYANLKQYNQVMSVLQLGQDEGLFFFFQDGEQPFPAFLSELKSQQGFEKFYKQNQALIAKANDTSQMQYMLQIPNTYNKDKNYPLLIIMHGGIGSINDLQYHFDSERLQSEFIVAYVQGAALAGFFGRRFKEGSWQVDINKIYQLITSQYSIDLEKVVLAGPSMGAMRSIQLAISKSFPVKGLLLPFPVIPSGLTRETYDTWAKSDLRMAIMSGEHDWAFDAQKQFFIQLEAHSVNNRFLIFPELGHEYPDDFQRHINSSLSYLLY
ncbi:hypothetical protein [Agaribacterium sp. ZY112]|uniref:hypothetical protein n=1 Tax=Agaribacterium sp. ZY112 TaxID=3233574 RepID=UPI0035238929